MAGEKNASKRPVRSRERTPGEDAGQVERSYETGMDEVFKHLSGLTGLNAKTLYDGTLLQLMGQIGRDRVHFDELLTQARRYSEDLHARALQALDANQALTVKIQTNSAELDKAASDQRLRHGDIAINHQWNLEPSEGAAQKQVLREGVVSDAIAVRLVEALTPKFDALIAAITASKS